MPETSWCVVSFSYGHDCHSVTKKTCFTIVQSYSTFDTPFIINDLDVCGCLFSQWRRKQESQLSQSVCVTRQLFIANSHRPIRHVLTDVGRVGVDFSHFHFFLCYL